MRPYYEHGGITIYHGDCREVVPQLSQVDHVITDPPYSDYVHSNARATTSHHAKKKIDFPSMTASEIGEIFRLISPRRWLISFLDWRHIAELYRDIPAGLEFVRFGVWLKSNPMPQLTGDRPAHGWDGIAYFHNKTQQKRWNGGATHGNHIHPVVSDGAHPTGKPLKLLCTIVSQFTDPTETILDPFMGSGTTLRAAKDLGRKAIGIEIEEKYCEIAAKRLRQEVFNFDAA